MSGGSAAAGLCQGTFYAVQQDVKHCKTLKKTKTSDYACSKTMMIEMTSSRLLHPAGSLQQVAGLSAEQRLL